MKSTVRLLYYLIDFVAGYLLLIRAPRAAGRVLIIERGWWDMVVDWRRYAIRGPALARLLSCMVAKPDILFIVSAPAEVIRQRKPELPSEEIIRQLKEWRSVNWRGTRSVVVDNNRPLDLVVADMLAELHHDE